MRSRLVVIALAAGLLAAAPAASAASSAGTVTVTASGAAAKELRRAGVQVGAPKSVSLVDGSTRLTFTATSRAVGSAKATLPLAGTLRFTRRGQAVRFTSLRLDAGTSSVRLTGRVGGGARVTLLQGVPVKLGVRLDPAAKTLIVRPTTGRLGAVAARTVRTRLRLGAVPAGTFGPMTATAGITAPGTKGSGGTTTTPGSGTPSVTGPTTETTSLGRPATAVDVVSATVVWRVRESFIRYVNSGEGTTVRDGAIADPAENLPEAGTPLVYQFRFPFRAGWADPSGSAAVAFTGGVRFRYSAHTIDFTTSDPEIELNGAASRATFRLSGSDGTSFSGKRAVLVELRPGAAASRTVSPDGKTVTYDRIPAFIPAGAVDSVFAGFYLAGAPFGSVSITYTTT